MFDLNSIVKPKVVCRTVRNEKQLENIELASTVVNYISYNLKVSMRYISLAIKRNWEEMTTKYSTIPGQLDIK